MNKFFIYPDFKRHRAGLTIIELLVVTGIIAAMVAISIPAIRAMQNSFDSTGTTSMISAALSTARTLAISNRQYVGVRFQKAGDMNDVLNADQYMIFIIYDKDQTGWVCGFAAVEGYKPMKLPQNIGVIDKTVRTPRDATVIDCGGSYTENPLANFNTNVDIVDTTTFSIVFSPAGKLVIHEVRCRNKDEATDGSSTDTVFNTKSNVGAASPTGMFIEDYRTDGEGLGVETSRNQFYIYNREELKKITDAADRWDYINSIDPVFINPYTGGIIEK